jgi:hypothetical protein
VEQLRKRLSYANVMSTLAVFLVIGGATAIAAKVPRHSVGPRQLKSNAVTTQKIKANAVTTRKIKKNAVTAIKIKDNAVENAKLDDEAVTTPKIAKEAVTGAKIDAASTPFGQIVHEARGETTVALPNGVLTEYPLTSATYTQAAGSDDTYVAAIKVTIPDTCTGARKVTVAILRDAASPAAATPSEYLASRVFEETGTDALGIQIEVGPGVSFQPTSATSHTLSLVARAECETGGGVTASFGGIDVIGTK